MTLEKGHFYTQIKAKKEPFSLVTRIHERKKIGDITPPKWQALALSNNTDTQEIVTTWYVRNATVRERKCTSTFIKFGNTFYAVPIVVLAEAGKSPDAPTAAQNKMFT